MTNHNKDSCPEGLDSSQLLAYVDGEMDEATRRNLEQHVRECRVCTEELESLRRVDSLLREHPESLHPDEETLYHFAAQSEDPDGKVAAHLALCARCRDEVELLREMIAEGNAIPSPPPTIPESLRCKLDRSEATTSHGILDGLLLKLREFISFPFQMPASALATVAATLVIAGLCLPMWHLFSEHRLSPDEPRNQGILPGHGTGLDLSSGKMNPTSSSRSARLGQKSRDRREERWSEGGTIHKIPALTMDEAKKTDFFTSFHLKQDGPRIFGRQGTILKFKPAGGAFRDLVGVKVTLDSKQRIVATELDLARSFIDDKRTGISARDLTKSMLRSMIPEQDMPKASDLIREIEVGMDSPMAAVPSSGKHQEIQRLPTPGYQTFLGKRASYEQTFDLTGLRLKNEKDTRGENVLLITIFLR